MSLRLRRPIGAGGGEERAGQARCPQHTRSLCAQSPAQTEQWCCWFSRRRIIFGSAEIAAIRAPSLRCRLMTNNVGRDPSNRARAAYSDRRSSNANRIVSVARIRLDPGNLRDLSKGYFATRFLSSPKTARYRGTPEFPGPGGFGRFSPDPSMIIRSTQARATA